VSDFEQILNLISRVGFSFDEGDLTSFLGCWADDGVLNFVSTDMKTVLDSVPRQEMEKKLGGAMAGYPHKHFVSLPVVDIDGDEAIARYFTLYPAAASEPAVPGVSQSHMVIRRQADGRWKLYRHNLGNISRTRTDVAYQPR